MYGGVYLSVNRLTDISVSRAWPLPVNKGQYSAEQFVRALALDEVCSAAGLPAARLELRVGIRGGDDHGDHSHPRITLQVSQHVDAAHSRQAKV